VAAGRGGSLLVTTLRPVRAGENVLTVAVRRNRGTYTLNFVERDAGNKNPRTTSTTVAR